MRARRRAGFGQAETVFWLFSDEALGKWFHLPDFVTDDGVLMDALREPLSRRIRLAMDTFWGPALIGLEDVWAWLFYGRSWLARQVQTALEAGQRRRRRRPQEENARRAVYSPLAPLQAFFC